MSETSIAAFTEVVHGDARWLHVDNPDSEAFAQLEHDYGLHPVHLRESIQKVQHTQVERENDYLFLVIHYPYYNPEAQKIQIKQVGIFLGRNYLITLSRGHSPLVHDLLQQCQDDPAKRASYMKAGAAYLLYVLIGGVLQTMSDLSDIADVELDEIEDMVFDDERSDAQRIGKLRQIIVKLRRVIGPQRHLFEDLAHQVHDFTDAGTAKAYATNTRTANKLWGVIEEAKETVEIYKDADFTTSTEQTNHLLAILTLVFTFTIPITIVGTLYGMNVELPGGIEAGPWSFLGRYTTFIVMSAISVSLAVGMYLYFKAKKWF